MTRQSQANETELISPFWLPRQSGIRRRFQRDGSSHRLETAASTESGDAALVARKRKYERPAEVHGMKGGVFGLRSPTPEMISYSDFPVSSSSV
jgi:hypothetical protein